MPHISLKMLSMPLLLTPAIVASGVCLVPIELGHGAKFNL